MSAAVEASERIHSLTDTRRGLGLGYSCEDEVIAQLLELQRRAAEYARRDGRIATDDFFYAEQNALLVKDAEQYYRAMFRRRVSPWNLRDTHMAQSLDGLVTHLSRGGQPARVVIWAHNSHLGDARATEMARQGGLNPGELVRRSFGRQSVAVGFTTYGGSVTVASDWGSPAERKQGTWRTGRNFSQRRMTVLDGEALSLKLQCLSVESR